MKRTMNMEDNQLLNFTIIFPHQKCLKALQRNLKGGQQYTTKLKEPRVRFYAIQEG